MEQGETPEECLRRELNEEFGIITSVGEFVCESEYDYGQHHIRLLAYRVEYLTGEFHLDSHDEIRWVSYSEMDGCDFPEADKPIVRKLIEEAEDAI